MSFVVFSGGILNIFVPKHIDTTATKFISGFLKDVFNKLIMCILTMQVIILYRYNKNRIILFKRKINFHNRNNCMCYS